MKSWLMRTGVVIGLAAMTFSMAFAWSLQEAAAPYKGTTIQVVGLERPSYAAAQALTSEFEKETGINVKWVIFPYESTLKAETLNFVSGSNQYDAILTDVVWPGVFGTNKWVVPVKQFMDNPALADPSFDMSDFVPIWLKAFTWGDQLLGLPFDSYSGLLYYNKCLLNDAGFSSPPTTWQELRDTYGPKLTDASKGVYAFALQSARGETQSADAFARFLWPWGGSFLNPTTFEPEVTSADSQAGIEFRHSLLKYMPPGIVSDDHAQVVQLMAQGKAAMITEWSSFYATLADPTSSTITDCLGVTTEPAGPKAKVAAFGGFAYMVSSASPQKRQDAAWLFIQWLTSKQMAKPLVDKGAVVARLSADNDPALQAKYPYLKPMVDTWMNDGTLYYFRPRFPQWPQISEIVSNYGTQIELGQITIQNGLQSIATEMRKVLDQAGYYSGKTPKIQ